MLNFRSEGVTLTPQNLGTKTTPLNCSQTVRARILKFYVKINLNTLHLLAPLSTPGPGYHPNSPKLGVKNYPIKLQPNCYSWNLQISYLNKSQRFSTFGTITDSSGHPNPPKSGVRNTPLGCSQSVAVTPLKIDVSFNGDLLNRLAKWRGVCFTALAVPLVSNTYSIFFQ